MTTTDIFDELVVECQKMFQEHEDTHDVAYLTTCVLEVLHQKVKPYISTHYNLKSESILKDEIKKELNEMDGLKKYKNNMNPKRHGFDEAVTDFEEKFL